MTQKNTLPCCFVYFWSMQIFWLVTFGEKATGGGAFKFADLFKEKLDFCLDKEDEMDCLVAGANFLLKVGHSTYPFWFSKS